MIELLNQKEELSSIKKEEFLSYIQNFMQNMNIEINNLLVLGKTYRSCTNWSQKTFIGIINEYLFFYLEIENESCQNVIIDKNCEVIFDLFYNRELVKNEKDYFLKEMNSMILYQKLQQKFRKRYTEKLQKI